jgi:short chain dehydrogenase
MREHTFPEQGCTDIRAVQALGRTFPTLQADLAALINNAGLGLTGDFLSHDLAEELASIQVNVQALVGLSHALGAKMVSRGPGGIINLAPAFQPLPHMATYTAAKAFVLHFSEALKFELKGRGVKDGAFDSAELVVRRTLRSFDRSWRWLDSSGVTPRRGACPFAPGLSPGGVQTCAALPSAKSSTPVTKLASAGEEQCGARNFRRMSQSPKWRQFGEPRFDRPGIGAVVPGVSRLTRIFRPRKLAAKVRTIDLNAAFVARAGLDA